MFRDRTQGVVESGLGSYGTERNRSADWNRVRIVTKVFGVEGGSVRVDSSEKGNQGYTFLIPSLNLSSTFLRSIFCAAVMGSSSALRTTV